MIREGKIIKVDPRTRKIVHQFSFGPSSTTTNGHVRSLENGNLVFTLFNSSSRIYHLYLVYPDNRTKEIFEARDMQKKSSFRIKEIQTSNNIIFIIISNGVTEIDTTGQVINEHGHAFIIPENLPNSNF